MGKVRILRRQGKGYIELPPEILSCDELELFPLREGYYLLSMPLGSKAEKKDTGLSETEKEVLRKLLRIRFDKRNPPYVSKVLSQEEMEIIKVLEKKGHVNLFKGKKYRLGVYNINDRTYPLLKNAPEQPKERHSDLFSLLRTQGYIIIDRKGAFELSQRLRQDMKTGSVIGIKGFDGRFYVVTKEYLEKASAAIASVLKEDMDLASVSEASKLDADGCMAVLRLMAENGDIIEKKRGVFAPI